ncbi:diguanylate cyclase [Vibrio sp. YMD68]|uniref:diguanylate cyclase domain-containing protein n=1 Tax=Vibrio sp. YMD68 TaxID=3042300 RepID=UPI00249C78B6|nr:diguanylate cyclase [Vibrio sp. YMD68]WGW01655.1 diguanylate cyclase [Vibrio sp. YMD68]
MMNSILHKLSFLAVSAFLLVVLVTASLLNIRDKHQLGDSQLKTILEIQLRVDMLRSQLWVFLQHGDQESLEEVYIAQQNLAKNLSQKMDFPASINNLKRMNHSLAVLLRQEINLYSFSTSLSNTTNSSPSPNEEAILLLHSRYNMIVQTMEEELFHLQTNVLRTHSAHNEKSIVKTALILLFFSIMVAVLALLILKQFRIGSNVIKSGIYKLSAGDFSSRIAQPKLDEEFAIIVDFFNEMKGSLQEHTVTKDQLEKEIKLKTSTLRKQTDQLQYLSERDSLTGVLNRRAFHVSLEKAMSEASKSETKIAIIFIDLDKFKLVNDTKGHLAGDKVLLTYASRLKEASRPTDIIGRLGGDEFAVCLTSLSNTHQVESTLQALLTELDKPIALDDEDVFVNSSIGVSIYPTESESLDELLDLADKAMYQAKKQSSSAYHGQFLMSGKANKAE